VYKVAQEFNWDKPTSSGNEFLWHDKRKEPNFNLEEKKDRRIIFAVFMMITTFSPIGLIANENDHLYMLEEEEWEKLGIPKGDDFDGNWYGSQNATRISIMMQLVFLVRKGIRLCESPTVNSRNKLVLSIFSSLPPQTVEQIHTGLITWHHSLNILYKPFNSLVDFLKGPVKFSRRNWIIQYCNLQQTAIYLEILCRIHDHNSKNLNPSQKFKFSPNSPVTGTSLDIILVCLRAFVSILEFPKPAEGESDYLAFKNFYFCLSFDGLVTKNIIQITKITVSSLKEGLGWASVSQRRSEVFTYLQTFMKVLKLQNMRGGLKAIYKELEPMVNEVLNFE
ncbi:hypothetical protein HDU92_007304, partial [Lobulomyces angularis]